MSLLEKHVVDAIAARALGHLDGRSGGHCVQIANLPYRVADLACAQVDSALEASGDFARLVVQRGGAHPWHATPTKIVELRNHVDERDSRLVVFIPAGEHLAVEDSFGESTFEILDVGDLYHDIADRSLNGSDERRLESEKERTKIIAIVRGDARFAVTEEPIAAYLARLVDEPSREELGRALTELRLLPDSEIGDVASNELQARLIRNSQQIAALTEPAAPAERLRRLPLNPSAPDNRQILEALQTVTADGTLDSGGLAHRLGEPAVLDQVDFSRWRIDAIAARPDDFRVLQLIGDLTGDADPIVTKAVSSVGVKFSCRPAPARIDGLTSLTLEMVAQSERGTVKLFAELGYEATKRGKLAVEQRRPVEDQDRRRGPEHGTSLRFRRRAWNDDNALVGQALSPHFRIGDEPPESEPQVSVAASIPAARVLSRGASDQLEPDVQHQPELTLTESTGEEGQKIAKIVVRFGRASVATDLRMSRILAMLERETLSDPEQLGRYEIELGENEIANVLPADGAPPEEFLREANAAAPADPSASTGVIRE